jgi:phosphoribosyl 1,2-cyclic phosphodiesterase
MKCRRAGWVRRAAGTEYRNVASPMRICLLASGSNGNCCLVEAGELRLLIDVGIGSRRLTARLEPLGLTPADISAVLVTHAHDDHIGGLEQLIARQDELAVYATNGAARALPEAARRRTRRFRVGQSLRVGPLSVFSFTAPHDAPNVCFRVEGPTGSVGYATDLGHYDAAIVDALSAAEVVIVEANHCPTMLARGPYPRYLKRRVAGPFGHLSNQQCRELLERVIHRRTRHVILAHLSEVNNAPVAVRAELEELLDGLPGWELGSRSAALAPLLITGAPPPRAARRAPNARQLYLPFE